MVECMELLVDRNTKYAKQLISNRNKTNNESENRGLIRYTLFAS